MTAPLIGSPREGFYRTRLIRNAMYVGVMIWWGRPIIDGQMVDRSPRWCVAVDGRTDKLDDESGAHVPLDVFDVWPWCCGEPISHRECAFMKRRAGWAREHEPEHPAANPRRPIDRRKLRPLIGGKS